MSFDILGWPAPIDAAIFESLCLDLWKDIWGPASDAQKNGRSGQKQAGVDVFGKEGEGRWVGVQCKQRNEGLLSRLGADELEAEAVAAQGFKPRLSRFIVATTGAPDVVVQERARVLTDRGPFPVSVWFWPDILRELFEHPALLRRIAWKYWPTILSLLGGQKIRLEELPRVYGELVGREKQLADLDAAWNDPQSHIVTIVAWGGVGKTALLAEWEGRLAARDFDGADAFDWSFYSQGTRDEVVASGEPFLDAALRFFGDEEGERIASSPRVAEEKGRELAAMVARRKALLVLDGLEPLQYPPSHYLHGELRDSGVAALLKGLAVRNPGLCVVTTRESVADLKRYRSTTAPEWKLEGLDLEVGAELLQNLGVWGSKDDLETLVEDVDGHALTLNLIGTFLVKAHGGDVRKRDRVRLDKADAKTQGGHAFKAIAAYENWLGGEEEGARQLAILRLLGLFDRPASAGCLAALRKEPAIPGLTDAIVGLDEEDWSLAVSSLSDCGLLSPSPVSGGGRGEGWGLDAHPLLREYFAKQLREKSKEAWRAAHGRLFEHLRDTTPHQPDTLEGLQPLYQAVAHGCHAGRYEEARAGVYRDRILRGTGINGFYSTNKFGAFGADLGAVACFFDSHWGRVSPALSEVDQDWLLAVAAYNLHALGRLQEALEAFRAGLPGEVRRKDWVNASRSASNLSELELTLGDVPAAMWDGEQSVIFADQSEDLPQRVICRSAYANALKQAGRRPEALSLFCEAERLQKEWQPEFPRLYSLRGFRFCDLLLAKAEREAGQGTVAETDRAAILVELREVEERAAQFSMRALPLVGVSLFDSGAVSLTLGRAALYRSILFGTDSAPARAKIEQAVADLRRAGYQYYLPLGLLTRAWLYFVDGDATAARADLDEAQEIAERGPMPLYLADIALYRGRLFRDREALAVARGLIERHGYGRRLGELADSEAALGL